MGMGGGKGQPPRHADMSDAHCDVGWADIVAWGGQTLWHEVDSRAIGHKVRGQADKRAGTHVCR